MTTKELEKVNYLLSESYSEEECDTILRIITNDDLDTTDLRHILNVIYEWNNNESTFRNETYYIEYLDSQF